MSKIVQAINVMLQHPENISNVMVSTQTESAEYFFLYKNYKWSMLYNQSNDIYNLFYYPGQASLEELAALTDPESAFVPFIRFGTKDIGTKEAYSTFQELYQSIQSKLYNVDEVLIDIIKDEPEF